MGLLVLMSVGCVAPKKYPAHLPFIYKININIQGNLPSSEKLILQEKLKNQLDDSLKIKEKTIIPLVKRLMKPPAFDSIYARRSATFMSSALYSLGYYKAVISWDSSTIKIKNQQRVTVTFTITPGKSYRLDSVVYQFQDPSLQAIALANTNNLLKKGMPYSVDMITAELDRLLEIFKNKGYYRITKEDVEAERDTVFAALLNPLLDPFERLELLQQIQARKKNPMMNIVLKLKKGTNPKHLRKYFIRTVSVYPDLDLITNGANTHRVKDTIVLHGIKIYNQYKKFKPSFIAAQSLLKPGEMYQLNHYLRTYANFAQLGTWAQVNIDILEPKDSSAVLDIVIRMYPNKKQDISVTLDGSYNTGNVFTTGKSNLFGTGLNFGLNNRNIARKGIQSSTNLRAGVELGVDNNIIQTFQTNLSHTINFPQLITPFKLKGLDALDRYRTQLNFNIAYTDRRDFFELRSLNTAWGYEWGKKKHRWYYSPLNVEFVQLTPRPRLQLLLDSIPNLQFSFNSGLVISQILGYNFLATHGNKTNSIRVGLEECGLIFGSIASVDKKANLYRYVKLDIDYRHYINYKKTALAFRLYAGMGIPYGKQENGTIESSLPFFKSFTAGGPYSMRAWPIRQLGPGSSAFYDTLRGGNNDRFGDVYIEGNAEYRFDIGSFWGIKIKSALFIDMGNVWYRSDLGQPDKFKNAQLHLNTLYKDLAVAGGTSLRVDFDYFLIRLDWAYKLKNPLFASVNNGWLNDIQLNKGRLQLGINYPF
jgi:outer membrane protein insertion porin family